MLHFPVSGVETYWWLPILVAFIVSSLASTGGLSGAFLLLPFQVSFLGFAGPAVTPTNLIFNIIAIPSGVYRYWKEKRMVWSIFWATSIGTLPGIFLGALIRIKYFLDPRAFKLFVAVVLLYLGIRLIWDIARLYQNSPARLAKTGATTASSFEVRRQFMNLKQVGYVFEGILYTVPTWAMMLLSFVVGIIGGIYGIGGGAIITPFLVAVFKLPVHSTAGASLLGTCVTSIAGVLIYTLMSPFFAASGVAVAPDWLLGVMFGVGGVLGMYLGARAQRYLSAKVIKTILAACLLFIATKYIWDFFG